MKQLFFLFAALFYAYAATAQNRISFASAPIGIEGSIKKDIGDLKAGTPFTLMHFAKINTLPDNDPNHYQAVLLINGVQKGIPLSDMSNVTFTRHDATSFWLERQIDSGLIQYYQSKGRQEIERKEMRAEADEYLSQLVSSGLIYEDAALEDYIHCLMLSALPQKMIFNRYGTPYVRLLKSPNPDALMLANNCLLISTGLIATLDNEDELFSILARETAHFVLDHAMIACNKNTARIQRAAFWGSVLDGIALAGEQALMNRSETYTPGTVFATNNLIQACINSNIIQRLGLNYTKSQEEKADQAATDFLIQMNKDPYSLVSALGKIQKYYQSTQDMTVFGRYGIYGTLENRLEKLQKKFPKNQQKQDRLYLKRTAGIVSFTAGMTAYNNDFSQAMGWAQKNIDNHLAFPEDYIVTAQCVMKQNNTPESNRQCLELLRKAEDISQSPLTNATKLRVLLLLRSGDPSAAQEEAEKYQGILQELSRQPHSRTTEDWLSQERAWIDKLAQQLRFF